MKNMDSLEILAWMLAGEHCESVRDEEGYQRAKEAVDADPELQDRLRSEKAFLEKYSGLVSCAMPTDTRDRILQKLHDETTKNVFAPLPAKEAAPSESQMFTAMVKLLNVRQQFAWAALLALLLCGIAILSTKLTDQLPPSQQTAGHLPPTQQGFEHYASNLVAEGGFAFDHEESDFATLVSWSGENNQVFPQFTALPHSISGMGCTAFKWEHGRVTLICFSVDGEVFHIFATSKANLSAGVESQPNAKTLLNRSAMSWTDESNAYLLISHDEGAQLPEEMSL